MSTAASARHRRAGWFVFGGLVVTLLLAGWVSNYASPHPDGLDSAAAEGCVRNDQDEIIGGTCPALAAKDHELDGSPLADYGVRGLGHGFVSTGLAGVTGVLVTFALGTGLFWLVRRRAAPSPGPDTGPSAGAGAGRSASAE